MCIRDSNNVGHCHPRVVNAIKVQAEKLIHTSNLYYTEIQALLAERMTKLTGLERCYLTTSGAESTESAMKLARRVTGTKGFISGDVERDNPATIRAVD